MSLPQLRFLEATLHRTPTQTRMPFRFGIAVMTQAPHVFLHATYLVDGRASTGVAAEGLLPKWFDKTPEKTPDLELEEMLLVIRQAVGFAQKIESASAFEFWQQLYERQMTWARSLGLPPLLAHFGVSMIERTLLDALARVKGTTLFHLFRDNLVGLELGLIHGELIGRAAADFLPERPLSRIVARHTVGLSDPLTGDEIKAEDRLADGLPQALEDCIHFYGLRHFKLKLRGELENDLARLRKIAEVITRVCGSDYAFTLDGNEQYKEFTPFVVLWERIQSDPFLAVFFSGLLFIEQPLHRSIALSSQAAGLRTWKEGPPMIIDESDAEVGDLAAALELGYAGTSHKNCKGVMKGVAHRCLLQHLNHTKRTDRYRMSGEDLVNIGPVALQQDLAAQATLGNVTVERNGHHYFRGLSPFPESVNMAMLELHPDLYVPSKEAPERGVVARLNVCQGELVLGSINEAPFGTQVALPLDQFESLPL